MPYFIPTVGPEDWQRFLAKPEKHWKTGHSARALAYCWEQAQGFPAEVKLVFQQSDIQQIKQLELVMGFPEFKVSLPGGSRGSQNDIWVLGRGGEQIFSIAVEGKATTDAFDQQVFKKLKDASDGMKARIIDLAQTLNVTVKSLEPIKYQLVHRTASALKMAKLINAPYAMLLVHSFDQNDAHFEDYSEFLEVFGLKAPINQVAGPHEIGGMKVFFTWVRGNEHYLTV